MTQLLAKEVADLVRAALTRAASQELTLRNPKSLVYMRSRAFCGAIASEMRGRYPAGDGIALFSGRIQSKSSRSKLVNHPAKGKLNSKKMGKRLVGVPKPIAGNGKVMLISTFLIERFRLLKALGFEQF